MRTAVVVALIVALASADVYMHNPRGSNNRLNEANTNRNNGNRLMDTQNNGKGGYCWGPSMEFYTESMLRIEWTSQHSCGGEGKTDCDIVLQYMCAPTGDALLGNEVRDGTTTNQIPNDEATYNERDSNNDFVYGMHESYYYYQNCSARQRNEGLFIADQNVGNSARSTRQNPGGGRSGFECSEERDYWPYWHPAPWKDIAVLTTRTDKCSWFQAESQNVKAKNFCSDPVYNAEDSCNVNGGDWLAEPAWGLPAPECLPAPYQRDNHLGNTDNGKQAHYDWKMPSSAAQNCVLRMRYNVTTADYDPWNTDASFNAANSPITDDPDMMTFEGTNVTLALDTTQFGRTFQDRSHVFHIIERPASAVTNLIYNLNVRGKRGNIVQTYPSTEYDFVPTELSVNVGDYIHFQWTGCDTNPAGNDGEGTDQTDRSNIVQISSLNKNHPARIGSATDNDERLTDEPENGVLFENRELRLRFTYLDQDPETCLTLAQLYERNSDSNGNVNQDDVDDDVENCFKLNKASQYFNGGLIKMNSTGTFHYMSSRNNNYTNRGQKATLNVTTIVPTWSIAVLAVGGVAFAGVIVLAALKGYAASHPGSSIGSMLG